MRVLIRLIRYYIVSDVVDDNLWDVNTSLFSFSLMRI